jgi:hypothetical protein
VCDERFLMFVDNPMLLDFPERYELYEKVHFVEDDRRRVDAYLNGENYCQQLPAPFS